MGEACPNPQNPIHPVKKELPKPFFLSSSPLCGQKVRPMKYAG